MLSWLQRIALLAFAVGLCATVVARADARSDAEAAYVSGDFNVARKAYHSITQNSPGDTQAWLGLARSCAALEDWPAAASAFEKLIQLGPVDSGVRTEYGDVLRQAGRLKEAIEQYNIVVEGAPADQAALSELSDADTAYAAGDFDEALGKYRAISAKYPLNPLPWIRIARIHTQQQDWNAALTAYEKLGELGALNGELRLEYGDALRKLGRLEEAVTQYSIAATEQERSKPALSNTPEVSQVKSSDEKAADTQTSKPKGNLLPTLRKDSKASDSVPAKPGTAEGSQAKSQDSKARKDKAKPESVAKEVPAKEADGAGASGRKQEAEDPSVASLRPSLAAEKKKDSAGSSGKNVEASGPEESAADDSLRPFVGSKKSTESAADIDAGTEDIFARTHSNFDPPPADAEAQERPLDDDASQQAPAPVKLRGFGNNSSNGSRSKSASAREDGEIRAWIAQASGSGGGSRFINKDEEDDSAAAPAAVSDWLDEAKKLAAAERWAEAVYAWEQLARERELSREELLQYGDALAENKDLDEAEGVFNTVLHDEPDNIDAKLGLAKVLAYSGKLDEAMYLLDQVQETADSARQARLARAKAYFANDYIQETWRDIGEMLASEPGNEDIVQMINSGAPWPEIKAKLESRPGNEDVIDLIERLNAAGLAKLGLAPTDDTGRAELSFSQGDFEGAKRQFEHLLRIDPTNITAYKRLGDMYRWDAQWDDALWAYENYIQLEPDDPEGQLHYAQVILYSGDPEAAIPEIWTLITNPNVSQEVYEEAVATYAAALNAAGRPEESLKWFIEALTLNPDNLETRTAYADALAGLRRFDDAFEQYNLVLGQDPGFGNAIIGLARTYSWTGDQETSISYYDSLMNDERYYVSARVGKAYSLLWAGQRGQALQMANEAAAADADNDEVLTLFERLGEKPPVNLALGLRQSHDSEDNDYSGRTARLIVPLDAAGAQAVIEHEDFKLDNTDRDEVTTGTHTRLTVGTPMGDDSYGQASLSYLNLNNGADPDGHSWNWSGLFSTELSEDWRASLGYQDTYLYDTTQIARADVRLKEWTLGSNFRLGNPNTHLLVSYAWADLTDDNSRDALLLNLRRTVHYRGTGTLGYGISYYRLAYDHQSTSGYWDPEGFQLTEIYADWLDQTGNKWMFDGGAGLGYAQDDENGSNYTFRYNAGVRVRVTKRLMMRAGYEHSETATNAASTGEGYSFGSWYLTGEYDF